MKAFITYELPDSVRLNDNAITHEHAIKEPSGTMWHHVVSGGFGTTPY